MTSEDIRLALLKKTPLQSLKEIYMSSFPNSFSEASLFCKWNLPQVMWNLRSLQWSRWIHCKKKKKKMDSLFSYNRVLVTRTVIKSTEHMLQITQLLTWYIFNRGLGRERFYKIEQELRMGYCIQSLNVYLHIFKAVFSERTTLTTS